jgi:hypothetical protein
VTGIISVTDRFREAEILEKLANVEPLTEREQRFLDELRERRERDDPENGIGMRL